MICRANQLIGFYTMQKQPSRGVAKQLIEIVLRHGCSPVNLLHIFRTPLPKNTSEGLLLTRLFIKPGIQERGTECEERGECSLGFRGILQRIPGNVIILTFRGMFKRIPGNVLEDTEECFRRFRGIFERIPGNVQEDSEECSRRFRGI